MRSDEVTFRPTGPDISARLGFGRPREVPDGRLDTVSALRVWVQNSGKGALMPYNRENKLVSEYVAKLAVSGFVTPHLMRHPTGAVIHVVQRTRVPVLEGQL